MWSLNRDIFTEADFVALALSANNILLNTNENNNSNLNSSFLLSPKGIMPIPKTSKVKNVTVEREQTRF